MEIPQEESSEKALCNICQGELDTTLKQVKIRVCLGQNTLCSFEICDDCFEDRLKLSKEKLTFLRLLQVFKKYNHVKYKDDWDKEAVTFFIIYLKNNNLKIKDYGVEVCSDWVNGESKIWELMDLIKEYKIDHKKINSQTNEETKK